MSLEHTRAFQPVTVGSLTLRNRIVMAPMTRRMAGEDGIATDAIAEYYRRRAAGEVGLIVSEGTGIDGEHAYDTLTVPRFETDPQLEAWRRVVAAVHEEGGAFAPQLWHTGRHAAHPIGPVQEPVPRPERAQTTEIRAMEDADFATVLEAYARSARGAREIGCDALEIHGAHGYLLDSFLSPATNRREDRYGGSVERRMRFPLEVARTVRDAVGPDFPVIYRFSQWKVDDYEEVKFPDPDSLGMWVTALRDVGVSILHVSTRSVLDPAFPDSPDHPDRSLAAWAQALSGLPTIGVGKVAIDAPFDRGYEAGDYPVADPGPSLELVDRGDIDLLAVGRSLIANPDWVRVVRDSGWQDLRTFSKSMLGSLE